MSGSYNAVTWLLDRNVEEGRGGKLAFTDTVSDLTYGDLAVFVGFDRHAQGRSAFAFQSRRDRGNLCQAGARHSRGRRLSFGGKIVFRLRPRQRADVPDVGRRLDRAQSGASDAGDDVC